VLTVYDGHQAIDRRRFLTIGGLGLGGLSLSSLLGRQAAGSHLTGKSIIFLFQQGGPSQFETFDPKPDAPAGIRTVNGIIQTSLPGVQFGGTMEQLAKRADRFTTVRSFQTRNGGHNIQPIVGPDSRKANIGAHYARVVGPTNRRTGMPTTSVLYPAAVCSDVPGPRARGNLASTGEWGAAYQPFIPGGKSQLQKNMKLKIPRERFFGDRRHVLKQLDRLNRLVDSEGQINASDDLQRQAYEILLSGGVAKALDLSQEAPSTLAAYDTSRYERRDGWSQVSRGRKGYYTGNARSLGKLLLLGRRLCEAGCGFVTIHAGYSGVWDMHADGNNLNMTDGMDAVGKTFDHAVAAFIDDLESRGLQDKILLICCGEMGRTPRINRRGGRDHWGRLSPLLLYGGGAGRGSVIGQSDRRGSDPSGDNLNPKNLIATVMHTVFDVPQLRITDGIPPTIMKLASERPIG